MSKASPHKTSAFGRFGVRGFLNSSKFSMVATRCIFENYKLSQAPEVGSGESSSGPVEFVEESAQRGIGGRAGESEEAHPQESAAQFREKVGIGLEQRAQGAAGRGSRPRTSAMAGAIRVTAHAIDTFPANGENNAPRWRGYSSAGRALAWHARGRRFDPA